MLPDFHLKNLQGNGNQISTRKIRIYFIKKKSSLKLPNSDFVNTHVTDSNI